MNALNAATITRQLNAQAAMARSNSTMKRAGLLEALLTQVHRWWRTRRDEAWLMRQPDYLLRDIGLERNEINRALRETGYR
jgi:uncharacterized protein YjiS (DUF1127 family)